MATTIEQLKAAQLQNCVLGTPTELDTNGNRACRQRLEIDEFLLQTDTCNLFLLALIRMQKSGVENDPWSWFGISSIHGVPAELWCGIGEAAAVNCGQIVPGRDYWQRTTEKVPGIDIGPNPIDLSKGYCTHTSALFPMWHRAYMLMMEQAIFLKMAEIAKEFEPAYRPAQEEAAKRFRMPYWDPCLTREMYYADKKWRGGLSKVLVTPEILVYEPKNPKFAKPVSNPLYCYKFPTTTVSGPRGEQITQPKYSLDATDPMMFWDMFTGGNTNDPFLKRENIADGYGPNIMTLRAPGPEGKMDHSYINDKFSDRENGGHRQMNILMHKTLADTSGPKTWLEFSNRAYPKLPGKLYNPEGSAAVPMRQWSVENFHDAIHSYTGQGTNVNGHMWRLQWSAFDPIFWLHHCNIDRLTAIWQRLNWNQWSPWSMNSSEPTAAGPSERIETQDTPLLPFMSSNPSGTSSKETRFWTSDQLREWRSLGYDYADIPAGTDTSEAVLAPLRARLNLLYEWARNPDPATSTWFPPDRSLTGFPVDFGTGNENTKCLPTRVFMDGGDPMPVKELDFDAKPVSWWRRMLPTAIPITFTLARRPTSRAPTSTIQPTTLLATAPQNIQPMTLMATAPQNIQPMSIVNRQTVEEKPAWEWTVFTQHEKFSLGGSHTLHFFLTDPGSNLAEWAKSVANLGEIAIFASEDGTACSNCARQRHEGLLVRGSLILTHQLARYVRSGETVGDVMLKSLEPKDVVPFLKQNLTWRLADKWPKERPLSELKQLKVVVSANTYTPPAYSGAPGVSGEYHDWAAITEGKEGGLREGEVF